MRAQLRTRPRRLASAGIDLLVIAAISAPFLGPTLNRVFADTSDPAKATFSGSDLRTLTLISIVIQLAYFTAMHAWRGSTVDKMAARTVLVRDDGSPVTPGVAFTRAATLVGINFLSGFAFVIPAIVNMLRPIWNPRRQTWHDQVARTRTTPTDRRASVRQPRAARCQGRGWRRGDASVVGRLVERQHRRGVGDVARAGRGGDREQAVLNGSVVVHAARPDVIAAAHSHSLYGKAFSALGKKLDPLTKDACAFYGDHELFDDCTGVVLSTDEGKRIAVALGEAKAVILRDHGLLNVGHSVDEAVWWFITMERTCQAQLLAEAAGPTVKVDPEMAATTQTQVGGHLAGWLSFPADIRPHFRRAAGPSNDSRASATATLPGTRDAETGRNRWTIPLRDGLGAR